MPRRDYYLNNRDEPIAAQKRIEQEGSGVLDAVLLGGTVAAFVLLRKKIALSRMFSERVKTIGEGAGRLSKYIIRNEMKTGARFLKRTPLIVKNWREAIFKELPSIAEQRGLAESIYKRYFPKVNIRIPSIKESGLQGWKTFLHGPAYSAIAEKAGLGIPTAPGIMSGKYGGIAAGKKFFRLGKSGRVEKVFEGIEQGLPKLGGRIESLRRGIIEPGKGYESIDDFFRKVLAPRIGIKKEAEREVLEKYLYKLGITNIPHEVLSKEALSIAKKQGIDIGKKSITTSAATRDILAEALGSATTIKSGLKNVLTPSKLFKERASAISRSVDDAIEALVVNEIKKPKVKLAYKLYRAQIKTGFGEMYARAGAGEVPLISPHWYERTLKNILGVGYKHPKTGRFIPTETRKFIEEGISMTGMWGGKIKGDVYLTQAGRRAYRSLLSMVEGTFYSVPEEFFGIGITARRTGLTDFISKTVGAAPTSWTGYAIRRHAGSMGRLLGYGAGAYYGFKFINYLARQATGGWGVTDVAGKMYTSAREFQQTVLDQAGLIEAAGKMENAFPGLIKSPAAHAFRMTAPVWMAAAGKKIGGTGGAKMGLALGIATALITWGDITQSPEELHDIFTGERDIPVRKGRYWPFGRTPFFGGKVKYWRPHWYPMMRSKYKFQGQLWDSETEYWAQGTALSPILAPILQGRMWDPYYWEKKHYQDRPYPITGELFEPTMPLAWLGNLTIGNIIKPRKIMHPEYWGQPQPEPEDLNMVAGAGRALGLGELSESGKYPNIYPGEDASWETSMGLYTMTEQMGLRGFMMQQFIERLTGRSDIAPKGPVVESARKATSLERAYWDMNIGDPGGITEFFRRILPHRRRQVERWNPIENTMPDWLPGEDYYINFQVGDPYTKIEVGEARLPGPGYESLHRLHSGTPGAYDAVDRFMILCITGDILLKTKWSLHKKAKDIVVGDTLITHDSRQKEVTNVWGRKIDEDIVSIESYYNSVETLEITKEHKVLVNRDDDNIWIPAGDLNRDDYIAFPRPAKKDLLYNFGVNKINDKYVLEVDKWINKPTNIFRGNNGDLRVKIKQKGSQSSIPLFIPMDNKLAIILGLYLSEGCVYHKSQHCNNLNAIGFSFNINELHFVSIIKSYFSNLGLHVSIRENLDTNSVKVEVYGDVVAHLFHALCGEKNIKHIPSFVFDTEDDFKIELIKYYVEGDGWVGINNKQLQWRTSSVSLDLSVGIRDLLIQLGYVPTIRKDSRENLFGNIGMTRQPSFVLQVQGNDVKRILSLKHLEKIRDVNCYKQKKWHFAYFDDRYLYVKIKDIKLVAKKCTVYNFEVSGDHSYCTVGFCTHNSDVAPYSDEYKHYRTLARGMAKGDEYWEEQVNRHLKQRSEINKVYDFLELEPPEDVEGPLRVASKAYRRAVASFTNAAGIVESGIPLDPVSKLFPYKTAVGTYKDYRIYGSDFTSWGHPIEDFIIPMRNKLAGRVADLFGTEFIPEGEQTRREYEEYFDRLNYVKYKKLSALAEQQGNTQVASQYNNLAGKTMTGLNIYGNWSNIYSAMPKRERAFFDAFVHAPEEEREEILDMVPKDMEKLYKAQWNIVDRKQGKPYPYDVGRTASRDVVDYYNDNYLPGDSWVGWHPSVNLRDVKLKVVKNEGMDIHDFNLWQSQERRLERRPYTPTINNIYQETNPGEMESLKRLLYEQMVENGLINPRIYITKTASRNSRVNLNINVRRDQSNQYNRLMVGAV